MANEAAMPFKVVNGFKGINNKIDSVRLGLEWQLQADNVLCDDAGFLVRRPGVQTFKASGYSDVHGTRDGRLLAITTGDELVELNDAGELTLLYTGVTGAPFVWVELGYALFLMSTMAKWAIYPDRKIIWGSLCPDIPTYTDGTLTSDPNIAIDLLGDPISYPPPYGDVLSTRRSQIAVASWEPDQDRTAVYFSRPDYPHEFRLLNDFQLFAGRVTLLAEVSQGLVIGTDRAIYIDPIDSPLVRVADYGVFYGSKINYDQDTVYFWTERGLCKYPKFENLTDKQLAVTGRINTTAVIFPWQGSEYAIVSQSGTTILNQRAKSYEPMTISSVNTQGITP
jgi:hypothetical protein